MNLSGVTPSFVHSECQFYYVKIVCCLLSSKRVDTGECMAQIMGSSFRGDIGKLSIFVENIFDTIYRNSVPIFINK